MSLCHWSSSRGMTTRICMPIGRTFNMRFKWMLFGGGLIVLIALSAIYSTPTYDSSSRRTGRVVYEAESQDDDETNELAVSVQSETIIEQSRTSVETVRRMGGTVLLSTAGQVMAINLTGCTLGHRDLELLKDTPELYLLNLDNSSVSDDDLMFIHDLPRLRTLRLSRTRVTDDGLKHLKNLPALNDLSINDAAVTDAGMRHLWGLSGLTSVSVMGNQVTPRSREILQERLPRCNLKL
jgi:hypothetical protein